MLRFVRCDRYFNFLVHLITSIIVLTVQRNSNVKAIKVIGKGDILMNLMSVNTSSDYKVCSTNIYDDAHSTFNHSTVSVLSEDIHSLARKLNVNPGGEWEPKDCTARFLVAIIIPYRDREINLSYFIRYIHPFLQAQKIHYKIYLVEQTFERPFNQGYLNNVAFIEVLKDKHFPCIIFHDVNKIPTNLNNIYACTSRPRHMAVARSSKQYRLPYFTYFGGAVSFSADHFKLINGYSNRFYNWGREDDDMYRRVVRVGLEPVRFDNHISSYLCLARTEPIINKESFDTFKKGTKFYNFGLNSVNYSVINRLDEPLFTRIIVQLNEAK